MSNIESFKPKSFWERREGMTGMIVPVIAIILLGGSFIFVGNWIAPLIVSALKNTLSMILYGGALAAILFVLFDSRFRGLGFYAYASIMRFITNWFVSVDPIGICEEYIRDLRDKLLNIKKQVEKLNGQMVNLKREITTNNDNIKKNISMTSRIKAKQLNRTATSKNMMSAKLAMNESGRLKTSNQTLSNLFQKLELLFRNLVKIEEASEFLIRDTESNLDLQKRQRKAINAASSAINSAKKIMSGGDYRKIMYDQATEFILEDIGNKMGEIDRFMQVSENFMDNVDLQNGQFEEEGWAMLEEWENEDSLLLGKEKKVISQQTRDNNQVLDLEHPIEKRDPDKVPNQFANLFN